MSTKPIAGTPEELEAFILKHQADFQRYHELSQQAFATAEIVGIIQNAEIMTLKNALTNILTITQGFSEKEWWLEKVVSQEVAKIEQIAREALAVIPEEQNP